MSLEERVRELRGLKRLAEELSAEITAAEDAIKSEMGEREQMEAGEYRITWKPVTSSRIDTTALRHELPDIAARFLKETTTRRFVIA